MGWCGAPLHAQEDSGRTSPPSQVKVTTAGGTPFPAVPFGRGPGLYLNLGGLIGIVIMIWAWTFAADWINRDAQRLKLEHSKWNLLSVGLFCGLLTAVFKLIPSVWLGIPLLAAGWIAPLLVYTKVRNGMVEEMDKVLTGPHLRHLFAQGMGKLGIKISGERQDPVEAGKAVKLGAKTGKTSQEDSIATLTARQLPGFWPISELLAESINQRADGVLLDVSNEQVAVRFEVDGVWHDREPVEAELGASMLSVLKTLAGVKVEDRRSRQAGKAAIEFKGQKLVGRLNTAGTNAGERGILQFERPKLKFKSLEDIGMTPRVQERLKELMRTEKGIGIFSALPAHGLTTMIDVALSNTDRYVRNVVQFENSQKREREIENVHAELFDAAKPDELPAQLERVIRTYPDVIIWREGYTEAVLKRLCEVINEDKLVILSNQAKDASESLIRLLVAKAPREAFAKGVTFVLYQRLIRTLCEKCKVAYPPPPEILKRLRKTPEQLEAIYRPPTGEEDKGCKDCNGLGYSGRTALHELLVVNDAIRELLIKSPKVELIRQAAAKAGAISLQDEGLALVAAGKTSVTELARVLKE